MAPFPEPPLFEARTTPHQSGTPAGLRVIAGVVLLGSGALTALFLSLGAWPVSGFMGGEAVLVLWLLRAHRRWSGRLAEHITLAEGRLRVDRTDHRGRRRAVEFEAYWSRVVLTPRAGRVSELRLTARGRSTEIGCFLGERDKADLRQTLARALDSYRNPVFENPALETPGLGDTGP